jgi:NAD(P)-dependent dehydrogenase (short-subunit alcohol dehydrogenase family)
LTKDNRRNFFCPRLVVLAAAAVGVYPASKAALRKFVRVWAAELAPRGVRVNTIVPGPTDTPGLRGIGTDEASTAALLDYSAYSTVLARIAEPDESAAAVLFLASPQSSFVSGSELFATAARSRSTP